MVASKILTEAFRLRSMTICSLQVDQKEFRIDRADLIPNLFLYVIKKLQISYFNIDPVTDKIFTILQTCINPYIIGVAHM